MLNNILEVWVNFKKNKIALVGLFIASTILFLALFAELVAPHDPAIQNLNLRLTPPAWTEAGTSTYILGTDDFGRDILSRIIYGARLSLLVGVISVSISLFFGLILGSLAGYYGGKIDILVMRIIDIMLSIPSILLAIVIVAILGPNLFNAMVAIGIVGIPTYARLVRGSFLVEKEKEYVIATRVNGSSHFRTIFVVILPNCLSPIIVQATMGFAAAILEAAGLSFLGLGAQPPTPEWGAMLADSLEFISAASWMIVFPGLAIFLTVLGFNLMGDGLMDILDPKLKDK